MSAHRAIYRLGAIVLCCAFLAGCVDTRPTLLPEATLPAPTPAQAELEPLPGQTDGPDEPDEPLVLEEVADYAEFLLYQNIAVYEREGHTLLDASIVSEYPGTLVCVLDAVFYDGAGEVARGRLTDGSGQEVLYLPEGETRVYAKIDTDMPVTMLDFSFEPVGEPVLPLSEQA